MTCFGLQASIRYEVQMWVSTMSNIEFTSSSSSSFEVRSPRTDRPVVGRGDERFAREPFTELVTRELESNQAQNHPSPEISGGEHAETTGPDISGIPTPVETGKQNLEAAIHETGPVISGIPTPVQTGKPALEGVVGEIAPAISRIPEHGGFGSGKPALNPVLAAILNPVVSGGEQAIGNLDTPPQISTGEASIPTPGVAIGEVPGLVPGVSIGEQALAGPAISGNETATVGSTRAVEQASEQTLKDQLAKGTGSKPVKSGNIELASTTKPSNQTGTAQGQALPQTTPAQANVNLSAQAATSNLQTVQTLDTNSLHAYANPELDSADLEVSGNRTGSDKPELSVRQANAGSTASQQASSQLGNSRIGAEAIQKFAARLASRANGGSTKFEMRLDPPQLGRIEVKLEMTSDNRVQAVMTAERPEVLQDLQRGADALRRALVAEGFDLGSNDLEFQLEQQGSGSQYPEFKQQEQVYAQALDQVIDEALLYANTEIDTGHGYLLVPEQRLDIRA
jgi:hypothetical protein